MGTNPAQKTCQDRLLQLEEENVNLKRENDYLKRLLSQHQNPAENFESKVIALERLIKVLTEQTKELTEKNNDLKRLVDKKNQEIKKLTEEKNLDDKDKLDRLLLELQVDGQVCTKNCALCAVLKVCRMKLGYSLCGAQLALIVLSTLPSNQINREHFKCEKILDLLEKAKIVHVKSEYLFPEPGIAKLRMMNEVWHELMAMSEKACILGLKSANVPGGGHCVAFDLDSRRHETVMVYDPTAPDLKEANMDEEAFINYVKNGEGIRLYIVNFTKLEDTIHDFRDLTHVTYGQAFFSLSMTV